MAAGAFSARLEEEREKKKREIAAQRSGGSQWMNVLGGGLAATGAGIASGGNPALIAAGYQAGSAATNALTGDPVKPEDVSGVIGGGINALGALDGIKAAKAAALGKKEMSDLVKKLLAAQAR